MAIIDSKLEFSDAQALTVTAASTNALKLATGKDEFDSAKIQDIGESGKLWLTVSINTLFTSTATNVSLKISLQGSPSATAASYVTIMDLMPATILTTPTAQAINAAGNLLVNMPLPADIANALRAYDYVRLYYTCGKTFTAGKIDAFLSYGPSGIGV